LATPIVELTGPFREFGLHPQVIATASKYLGTIPILTGVTLLVSPHVPGNMAESQLFHCDYEDVRQVKVFVGCTDISAASGPLTAIPAAASRAIRGRNRYRFGDANYRLADEAVTDEPRVAFCGPAGTAVFIDTSQCFHLGSRVAAEEPPRVVVQFQYLTPVAFDLFLRRPPYRHMATTTPLERLVVGS
jgi:hypothetical protein